MWSPRRLATFPPRLQESDGRGVVQAPQWAPPKGFADNIPAGLMPVEYTPGSSNIRCTDSVLQTRWGTAELAAAASNPVMALVVFSVSAGVDYFVRFTTVGVERYIGGSWSALTGPALTGTSLNQFSWTAWNDKLLFANGIDGIFEANVVAGTYAKLTSAPIARFVSTFAGRVVATQIDVSGARVQWCVRNDNTDWTGLGSGFEDLLSTPGGRVDLNQGFFPVSDTVALMVRSNSIWQVTQTGLFDSPFTFERLYADIGTYAPYSIATIPGGIVMLANDDVLVVTLSAPQSIGQGVRNTLLSGELPLATGTWEPRQNEYCICVPGSASETASKVWRYSFKSNTWLPDDYQFGVRRIHGAQFQATTSIDDLAGTMDGLAGTYDSLGVSARDPGLLFAMRSSNRVARESVSWTSDVKSDGTIANVPFHIDTTYIAPTDSINRTEVVEIQIQYACTRTVPLQVDYSVDGGSTWNLYSTYTVGATTGTETIRLTKTLEASHVQLRLSSTDGLGFRLISFRPFVVTGARINS